MMVINRRIITAVFAFMLAIALIAEANIFTQSYDYFKNYLLSKETLKIAGALH